MSQYYTYPQPYAQAGAADQHCLTSGQQYYYASPGAQQQYWNPYYQQGSLYPDGWDQSSPGMPPAPANGVTSWFDFSNSGYLKGLFVGAGVAILLTNPAVQRALLAGGIKVWSLFQGGIEEVKEQVHDIRAEMSQESA
jgi:hypothetical protein